MTNSPDTRFTAEYAAAILDLIREKRLAGSDLPELLNLTTEYVPGVGWRISGHDGKDPR